MDLSHLKRSRQGDHGTHKLPNPPILLCLLDAAAGGGGDPLGWPHLQSAYDSFTGVSGSRASRLADGP